MNEPIMEISRLVKEYPVQSGLGKDRKGTAVKAVSDVSFTVRKGETFSLVGESGCGKTTLGRCLVRGIEATSGHIYYYGNGGRIDFLKAKKQEYKAVRQNIQMIFQDPYSSLNPRMTVYDIISEPLRALSTLSKQEIDERVVAMAEQTGLNASYLRRYPHAFSGGQRQRIGIARALVTNPKVIVCDEAVSALDVSIQAQIINLLKDLQRQYQMTYLFISHDLSVVKHISDRIAVMYLGKIVELADTDALFSRPMHPYSEALLLSVPNPDPLIRRERIVLQGEVPNAANPPKGCHFHPRCAYKTAACEQVVPELQDIGEGRLVACHHARELTLEGITAPALAGQRA
ncbi:ABC transporter ATP-binding protein [Paenibacillus protaetiae]|uniref:ATP-binding cassette domain-containing protein n=1 Tax=Paenibacillus protaetiae TaxID=2509456 RepID=A0A4P6EZN1_9BACL|nr:oligopeptide/dipeptide ABC transporter ATP-binding protein [Paenibacillus protaetiae]QAY67279.1 ATP-binding cassette domain-containing protein [Paenibacillus protaetiae]